MIRNIAFLLLLSVAVEAGLTSMALFDSYAIEVCDVEEGEKEGEKDQKEEVEKEKYLDGDAEDLFGNRLRGYVAGNKLNMTMAHYLSIPSPPPEC